MRYVFIALSVLILSINILAITGEVEKSYPTPYSCPADMASDGKYLYLADSKSDSIYKINPSTGNVAAGFPAPTYKPRGLTFDGKYLWVVDAENDELLQLDIDSQTVVKHIWCPAQSPMGLAWDGVYLWLADSKTDKLMQLSTEDGTTIQELPSPSTNPTGLAYDGTYLWVADRGADKIYMVWPKTGEVILMFDAPNKYSWGLAYQDGKLYNADYQADSIYTIVPGDDEFNYITDPVYESCEFTHQFRNYGPGTITDLNIYLAVPGNSQHQEILDAPVYTSSVNHDILIDQWGQKIARFHFDELKPGDMVQASYKTTVKIYDHWLLIHPEDAGELKDIPKEIKKQYLVDNTKFAIDSDVIKQAVRAAIGDETNPYWMMRKIFRYIIDHMDYELAGGWNIAPTILERGNGSCSEYSFVFIAMCRAAGLPARYEGSIVQRGDLASEDEVFHRWCQVYLPKIGWVPVDPSGGDQDTPEGQAKYIGHVSNRFLVTTVGGGGSEYLGWDYNSYETYQSQGICKTFSEHIGEWAPLDSSQVKEYETKSKIPVEY
jgi:hypothetical protein